MIEGKAGALRLHRCEQCSGFFLPRQTLPRGTDDPVVAALQLSVDGLWITLEVVGFVASLLEGI
jgi:hypothetical protein